MQANLKQLSFTDVYSNIEEYFQQDKPKLIKLFEQYINLCELIPESFFIHYHASTGHPRDFKLTSMISALILKKILSVSDMSVFITFLNLCSELRDLCGFSKVPHASQFSRFKTDFEDDLLDLFNHLVGITEPICKELNTELSSILIADTTGIEGYVKENNPKHFDGILRNSKKISKNDPSFNYHAYACSQMPKEASSNSDIKLSYINGHYCYSIKSCFVTNGLGILRHIDFYENNSIDIAAANSANEYKDSYDAKTLIPVLENYFGNHPTFSYKYFIGDAGFDAVDNYKYLYKDRNMIPIIPYNPRNSTELEKPGFNEAGIPTCPKDKSLLMKFDGVSKEKGRSARVKWLCPKSKKKVVNGKTTYILSCDSPCTDSSCGRIYHIPIDSDYRTNIAVPRHSEKWLKLFKLRTIIERTNFMVKYPMSLNYTKLRDTTSLKVEVILAGITQQIVLLIANAIKETDHLLSIKSIVA